MKEAERRGYRAALRARLHSTDTLPEPRVARQRKRLIIGSIWNMKSHLILQILDSIEVRQICARYVAHIFRRTCALRDGGEKLLSSMLTGYMDIANDASWFKGYAAKVSILTSQAIKLEELREALIKHVEKYSTPEGQQSIYVDDIDRGTKWLATQLEQLNWSVIQTNSADEFLSQTLRSSQKPRVPLAM
jgi:hypothetical protein